MHHLRALLDSFLPEAGESKGSVVAMAGKNNELLAGHRVQHTGKHFTPVQASACLLVYTMSNFVFGMICVFEKGL
ncbi:hypothetical protein AK812_SmicGene16004 [Symbiodinium microadriaticum]|uniref:Uncharacterized protein n=1 Tax=Symbiodinium microadriaticum TaxID=2951 RepID=A0A1Q9E1H0_SYMMI|nr:hypothetical protein AK812_SmicGene16004 [Symbiodinium microadriaticum]